MEAKTMTYPQEGMLLVKVSDVSLMKDIRKAISMVKGVETVKVQKPKEYDITKTAGYRAAMDDVKHGRVTTYASLDDFYKEMGL